MPPDNEEEEIVLEQDSDALEEQEINMWHPWSYKTEEGGDDNVSEAEHFPATAIDLSFERYLQQHSGQVRPGDLVTQCWIDLPPCINQNEYIGNFFDDPDGMKLKHAKEQKIDQLIKRFEQVVIDLNLAKEKL